MTSGTKMRLQFGALGVTMSWDESLLGARASRPHKAWHSLGCLPHLDQPGRAPWLSYGLADAVPADRVAACSIALKLSGGQRDRMRAGRPRSQGMPSRRCGGECLAGDFSESRRAPLGKLPIAGEPGPRPAVRIIRGKTADHSLMKMNHECTPINTNRSEDRWTSLNDKRHHNASAILCPWCDDVMG